MTTQSVTGKVYWFKALGATVMNMNDKEEWSFDVALDEANQQKVADLGLEGAIKDKGDDRGPFITFSRFAVKQAGAKKGEPNQPIDVLNTQGELWPEDKKIGNGSLVTARFNVYQVPNFKKAGTHPKAVILDVEVLELVEYREIK